MSSESKGPFLSEKTGVPLVWLLAGVLSAVTGTSIVMGKLNAIENAIASQRLAMAQMESNASDRWTTSNMDRWIDKTRLRNQSLNLPDVMEIKTGH